MGFLNFLRKDKKKPKSENDENEDFCMVVSNKFAESGTLFVEGKIKLGSISKGDKVYVFSKNGKCKHENKFVMELLLNGIVAEKSKTGDEYVAIALKNLINWGDIDYHDVISKQELDFGSKAENIEEIIKDLPTPKTYNDADRGTHINMATNDLSSIFSKVVLGGSLTNKEEEWVKNVGEDLYNAHGFDAMQEVFYNVKIRIPIVQTLLSEIWDGVGGWAD